MVLSFSLKPFFSYWKGLWSEYKGFERRLSKIFRDFWEANWLLTWGNLRRVGPTFLQQCTQRWSRWQGLRSIQSKSWTWSSFLPKSCSLWDRMLHLLWCSRLHRLTQYGSTASRGVEWRRDRQVGASISRRITIYAASPKVWGSSRARLENWSSTPQSPTRGSECTRFPCLQPQASQGALAHLRCALCSKIRSPKWRGRGRRALRKLHCSRSRRQLCRHDSYFVRN